MIKSLLSKNKKKDFYSLGREIKINKKNLFQGFDLEHDYISICKFRIFLAIGMFILAFFIVFIRLINLSIIPNLHKDISIETTSKEKEVSTLAKPIKRADILDRNGAVIATSLPTVNLYVDTKKLLNIEESAKSLHKIIPDVKYEDILRIFKKKAGFAYIKRNLTPTQQHQINALGLPALDFENGEKRVYPHEKLFSHIIGMTNIDNEGISGLESGLNNRLIDSSIPLQLTIDSGIQYTVREKLLEGVNKYKAEGGVAILLDVNTGEIISLVSLPDFNPNESMSPTDKRMFNFATKGIYEPGSVLKIFNIAMALNSGVFKKTDMFDARKPIKVHYHTISDYRGQNRMLSLEEVLIYSSNIGSAQIALKMGKKLQQDFLESLGFFEALNIDVAEKAVPMLPQRWGDGEIATVSYGYSLSVTPLHIISAFSPMINGGLYYPPSFVKKSNEEVPIRVISAKTSLTMKNILRKVVKNSAKFSDVEGYEVIGKTGTANKLVNGKYVDRKVISTFVAAFPASNPKYALYVMLDEPKGLKETWNFVTAGWNATPTAGEIIKSIAPQLNLEANYE